MNPRLLLCAALLTALPVLSQTEAQAVPKGQAAAIQAPPKPEATLPEMRVECTAAARAADLMGQHGCVAGRVSRITYTRSGAVHISLCAARSKCSFHAVALARDRGTVGDLSDLRGKIVAVVGDVTDYRGHPQIRVKNREQLQVAAGEPPAEFDAAQASAKGVPVVKRSYRAW
jgi:hypothetical protein